MAVAPKTQMLSYQKLLDGMASHVATPKLVPAACRGKVDALAVAKEIYPAALPATMLPWRRRICRSPWMCRRDLISGSVWALLVNDL